MGENLDNKIEELQKQLKVLELQKQIKQAQGELTPDVQEYAIPEPQVQTQYIQENQSSNNTYSDADYNAMEVYFVELFTDYRSINMAKNTLRLKSKSGVMLGEYLMDKGVFLISYDNVNNKFYSKFNHKFNWDTLEPFLYSMFLKYLNLSNILITTKALYENPTLRMKNVKETLIKENKRCEFGNFDKLQDMSNKGIL